MKPQRIYLITLVVWLCGIVIDAAIYLSRVNDALPTSDVYANSIGFQLIAYALTRAPYFAVALFCLLIVEFAVFGRKPPPHGPQA